jgi:competence protein ComEC
MVAIETISAELMTIPIILYVFGQISLIGLPANVFVVTLIPLSMLLGLLAGLAGMLIAPIASWLAWPAIQLLNYMLDIARIFASLPHTFLQNLDFKLGQMLIAYGLVAGCTTIIYFKNMSKNDKITDKNEYTTIGAEF